VARNLFLVFSNPRPGREAEYHRWYEEQHLKEVVSVPPYVAAQRYRVAEAQVNPQTHRFVIAYEFEGTAEEARKALLEAFPHPPMDLMQDVFVVFAEAFGERAGAGSGPAALPPSRPGTRG
jgi:hypothetical protein